MKLKYISVCLNILLAVSCAVQIYTSQETSSKIIFAICCACWTATAILNARSLKEKEE